MNAVKQYEDCQTLDLEDQFDILMRLGYAAKNFEKLLKCLYSYDTFDRSRLQAIISDLALDLGVDVPKGDLTITRRKSELMDIASYK